MIEAYAFLAMFTLQILAMSVLYPAWLIRYVRARTTSFPVERFAQLFPGVDRHIVITVGSDATDPSTVGTWDIEASSINLMVSRGWNRMTYRPGDRITVVAHPSRNGSKGVLLFYAIKADGTRLYRAQHRYPSEEE